VKQILPRGRGRGNVAQIMYTDVSKCKNDIIKNKLIMKDRTVKLVQYGGCWWEGEGERRSLR
jgi:hypothetical protein